MVMKSDPIECIDCRICRHVDLKINKCIHPKSGDPDFWDIPMEDCFEEADYANPDVL